MPNLSNNLFNWNFVRHCYIVCLFLFHVLFLFMMNLFQIFKLPSCNWRGTTGSIKRGGPQNWVIEFINKAICSMVREQAWKSRTKKNKTTTAQTSSQPNRRENVCHAANQPNNKWNCSSGLSNGSSSVIYLFVSDLIGLVFKLSKFPKTKSSSFLWSSRILSGGWIYSWFRSQSGASELATGTFIHMWYRVLFNPVQSSDSRKKTNLYL